MSDEYTRKDWDKEIEKLRHDMLIGEDDDTEHSLFLLTPQAEQHFLLSLAALEAAQRHFKLALLLSEKES